MSKGHTELRFPSGRTRRVVRSRHALARKIIQSTSGDWVKVEPHEEGAANSLAQWGMIERHHQTPQYVRWSVLHERPRFVEGLNTLALYSVPVHHLSTSQRELIIAVSIQTACRKSHDVLTLNDRVIQRKLVALERRKLLRIERRAGGVWGLWIADTYPGKKVQP